MTEFKFFDKKQKKFVSPFKGPENIWNERYNLGIWNNSIHTDNLRKMVAMNNKHFEIYVKHNKKYVIATNKVLDEILNVSKSNAKSKLNTNVAKKKPKISRKKKQTKSKQTKSKSRRAKHEQNQNGV